MKEQMDEYVINTMAKNGDCIFLLIMQIVNYSSQQEDLPLPTGSVEFNYSQDHGSWGDFLSPTMGSVEFDSQDLLTLKDICMVHVYQVRSSWVQGTTHTMEFWSLIYNSVLKHERSES